MRRVETDSPSKPLTRGGPLDALRFWAVFFIGVGVGLPLQLATVFAGPAIAVVFAVGFRYLVDWPTHGWVKARLTALLPHPDPTFDPFAREAERAPRVREILMHAGPLPCGFHGREQLEGSAGLAWG